MPIRYRARVADGELADRLRTAGAVLVEGPKACGKTFTAQQIAATAFRFDTDDGARALVSTAPEVLFSGGTPILFDEWQMAPKLWNLVRREVDDRAPERGQFILTGSATPDDDVHRHSGAGRISRLRMRPMSLFESGHSTGEVSLAALFDGEFTAALDPGVTVPQLVERMVVGGWPALLDTPVSDAQRWLADYLTTIVEVDIPQLGSRRAPQNLRRLLSALGRATGTGTSVRALAAGVGGEAGSADWETVAAYLTSLERLMLVEDVPAWRPHMRSTTQLRKNATRFMADPSLGIAALGVGPPQLLADLNATGFHFEALAVRDLRVYSQPLGATLSHWRDNNNNEVDIIITLSDGRWAGIEVKMNPDHVDAAASALLRFSEKVDTTRTGEPEFLAVLTTRTAAFRREDGVYGLPIAALGP